MYEDPELLNRRGRLWQGVKGEGGFSVVRMSIAHETLKLIVMMLVAVCFNSRDGKGLARWNINNGWARVSLLMTDLLRVIKIPHSSL